MSLNNRKSVWALLLLATCSILIPTIGRPAAAQTSLLPTTPAPEADTPVTAAFLDSEVGAWVGAGRQWLFPTVTTSSASRNFIAFNISGPDGDFNLRFKAPGTEEFHVGTYPGFQRYPFQNDGVPGFDVSGEGRGCNQESGTFIIDDLAFNTDRSVARFSARWEHYCENQRPATWGAVSYQSAAPFRTRSFSPLSLTFPSQRAGTTSAPRTLTVTNAGPDKMTVSRTSLTATDFSITADSCGGAVLDVGDTCTFDVVFSPAVAGSKTGRITFWDDLSPEGSGGRQLNLSGSGTGVPPAVPLPPAHLESVSGLGRVTLRWQASGDDVDAPTEGFDVLRNGVAIGSIEDPTSTSFSDGSATRRASYTVVARNRIGPSAPSATHVAGPIPPHRYVDVVANPLLDQALSWSAYRRVVPERSHTLFRPREPVPRSDAVVSVWNLMGQPAADRSARFPDVARDAWYRPAVDWSTATGVLGGYLDRTFRPDRPLLRGQLAHMLWRVAGEPVSPDADQPDVAANAWNQEAVDWVTFSGVMAARPDDGRFRPKREVTRRQLVLALHQMASTPEVWQLVPAPDVVTFFR